MWPFKTMLLTETIAELNSGEEILAKAKNKKPPGSNLDWTFDLKGKPFLLISASDGSSMPSVLLSEGFRISDSEHTSTTTKVELSTYYAHHHGSVSRKWQLTFNVDTMTASVAYSEHIDVDS